MFELFSIELYVVDGCPIIDNSVKYGFRQIPENGGPRGAGKFQIFWEAKVKGVTCFFLEGGAETTEDTMYFDKRQYTVFFL